MTSSMDPPRLLEGGGDAPGLDALLLSAADDEPTAEQLGELRERLDRALDAQPGLSGEALPPPETDSRRSPDATKRRLAAAVAITGVLCLVVLVVWLISEDDGEGGALSEGLRPPPELRHDPEPAKAQALLGEDHRLIPPARPHGDIETQPAPPVTRPPSPKAVARPPSPPNAIVRPPSPEPDARFAEVLRHYKAGSFERAAQLAGEIAASGNSEADRGKARSLERRIQRFIKAWQMTKATSARQKMAALEQSSRLDKQISGGHFGPQIRPMLTDVYVTNAERALGAEQYASGCQSTLRALKLDPDEPRALEASKVCEQRATAFFYEALHIQNSDKTYAKSLLRKVLNMVPRTSSVYGKSHSVLNNWGRKGTASPPSEIARTSPGGQKAEQPVSAAEALDVAKAAVLRGDQAGCIRALQGAPKTAVVVRTLWYCYYSSGQINLACEHGKRYYQHLNLQQKQAVLARCR